ncbi:unnamed protein product [Eruca vesicaria subsp. sativa]|uniref:GRF-type domain-containing protein n=1 Tax=Eruca vesicaria subsp. sativa TaxID=29727 RepID=A0ABC8LNV6_ERUVS|nr:unnamed protein product [Eruca vesicaria subsp. sativa]
MTDDNCSHSHNSPNNKRTDSNSPQDFAPEKTSQLQPSPSGTPDWLMTPKSPSIIYRSTIYDAADHPNSLPFHHLQYQGLQIFEPISPEPSPLNNVDPSALNTPRYDTSSRRDPPLHQITTDTSPNKSSGFAEHAHSVNAFAATATSKPLSSPIFDQSQEDFVDVSDSSPARPTPMHQPSAEECQLAAELLKQAPDPVRSLFAPLPQTLWEVFFSVLQSKKQALHITPSKFDFSDKFILEIAEPQNWITTFGYRSETILRLSSCEQHLLCFIMSSSSSSGLGISSKRSVYGIPKKCWCGKGLTIWGSNTKENPFRRFYRCEISLQRKSESHLFKWEDGAIRDEVRMVEAKLSDLVHDFKSLLKSVVEQLDSHKTWLDTLEVHMISKVAEHMLKMEEAMVEASRQLKDDMDATLSSNTAQLINNGHGHNFAVAVAIVGATACLYWKLL